MTIEQWDAEASVIQYPPLGSAGGEEATILLTDSLRACVEMVASFDQSDRANIEIETADGGTLFNAADIERLMT